MSRSAGGKEFTSAVHRPASFSAERISNATGRGRQKVAAGRAPLGDQIGIQFQPRQDIDNALRGFSIAVWILALRKLLAECGVLQHETDRFHDRPTVERRIDNVVRAKTAMLARTDIDGWNLE